VKTDAQAATAEAEHRVERVEFLDALLDLPDGDAHFGRQVFLRGFLVREEFVQGRIEEADGRRVALEGFENADEVVFLAGEELGERGFSGLEIVGEDHLARGVNAVALEEHVRGAHQANAGGAECDGILALPSKCPWQP